MKCRNCDRKVKANGRRVTFRPWGSGFAYSYSVCGTCVRAAHLDPEFLSPLEERLAADTQRRGLYPAKGGQA